MTRPAKRPLVVAAAWTTLAMLPAIGPAAARADVLDPGPAFVVTGPFRAPCGVAVDPGGTTVFVADTGNHRVRHAPIATLAGAVTWGELGWVASRSAPEALNEPQGVAVDAAGNVYVVDTLGGEVQLYRPGASGYTLEPSFASTTRTSVAGTPILLPRDVAVGADGKVYLLDSGNRRVLVADGPADDSWAVWRQDPGWANPYGLDVAPDGTVFVADTDHHRVVKLPVTGAPEYFGAYGTGDGAFRGPRDVAVGPGGRLLVADSLNHRVVVLRADGTFERTLDAEPLVAGPQKVAVDSSGRVFVADAAHQVLLAHLGPGMAPPFDLYVRDHGSDAGTQPSSSTYALSSPDLLVRHAPDVDLAVAAGSGLQAWAFEEPRFDMDNYVYVAVRNRGTHLAAGAVARLFWIDPSSPLAFPADWSTDGFYERWTGPSDNVPSATLAVASVAALAAAEGVTVVGPLIWRPPAPEAAAARDGRFHLAVRLVHPADPTTPATGLAQVRDNNNVAIRPVTVTRGPFPVGDQDTLVVRADLSGIIGSADETTVRARVAEAGSWIEGVSYGLARVRPAFAGPVPLDHDLAWYDDPWRTLLVELTTEVLTKLLAAQPAILDGPTADPADDVDRLVIVLNDPSFTRDWASTGHWPYEVGGTRRYLSVSIQGPGNDAFQFAHGLAHQLGLKDLYVHDHVDADPALLDAVPSRWDNMAKPYQGAHPLAWSKQLATWVTSSGGRILYIRRPERGTRRIGEPPIPLSWQAALQPGQVGAIAVGLTEGATTLESETQLYWIEARDPAVGVDPVPERGVIVYYAHNLVPQGEAPVILRDATPATPTRDDAALSVSEVMTPGGTGLRIGVVAEMPAGAGYLVSVEYDPPPDDLDTYVRVGDPGWTSPDIWVDNQRDGGGYHAYDGVNLLSGGPVEENPIADEENRVYARVWNRGPAPALDVEVVFTMSEPVPATGGSPDFEFKALRIIPMIPAGQYRDVFYTWRPSGANDPHNCVRVEVRRVPRDVDPSNNEAQQNLSVEPARRGSPYRPVRFDFQVTNDARDARLVYFRADGVPKLWARAFDQEKRLLAPSEKHLGALTLKPDDGAAVCTHKDVFVTAWTPRGDTLVRLGGTTVDVALRNNTTITVKAGARRCDPKVEGMANLATTHLVAVAPARSAARGQVLVPGGPLVGIPVDRRECGVVGATGCTSPPRPNQTVYVKYADPAGNPIWRAVQTDANGCYEDSLTVVEGGDWGVTAHYPGDDCSAWADASVQVQVPIATTGDQDLDGLPDIAEPDGDADGDGLPNQLDPDSDNDGLPDGQEPPGDLDHDGLDGVIDPDSDGDGTLDGVDPTQGGERSSAGAFVAWFAWDPAVPVHDLVLYGVRMERQVRPHLLAEVELAGGEGRDRLGRSGRVTQVALHVLGEAGPFSSRSIRVFGLAGIGLISFDGFTRDDRDLTLDAGVGAKVKVRPRLDVRADARLVVGLRAWDAAPTWNREITLGVTWAF